MRRDVGVLFVCLGNICRSPTAEGVFRARVEGAGLSERIRIASAGTAGWHVGKAPDPHTQTAAARRGYDLSGQRARQVARDDFHRFELVLAMDESNRASLQRLCPPSQQTKIELLLSYLPGSAVREVPDPWGGGPEGFEQVLDLVEGACDGLLAAIVRRLDA